MTDPFGPLLSPSSSASNHQKPSFFASFYNGLKRMFARRRYTVGETSLRETIEELIEESSTHPEIESDERELLGNVLNLRDLTAEDVMTPRADIVLVSYTATEKELSEAFIKNSLSRIPIFRENSDDIVGMVHIKDFLAWKISGKPFKIKPLIREVLFVSPTMRTLDLLFKMRITGSKMALVVDEYGGIDGLVTFPDLIEEIIGDIQDAHDQSTVQTLMEERPDSSLVVDGRLSLEELLERKGYDLSLPGMVDDIDTVAGLVVALAGRVPTRGELIKHPQGVEFEVVEADPRRVKRVILQDPSKIRPD